MIRPFYRSRLFWLGLPGLVFLWWAWWDSGGHFTFFRWDRGAQSEHVGIVAGNVSWSRFTERHPRKPIMAVLYDVERDVMHEQLPSGAIIPRGRFPPALRVERVALQTHDVLEVRVALWVVVTVYLVVWLGTVAIWQRRKSRLLKLPAAPPP